MPRPGAGAPTRPPRAGPRAGHGTLRADAEQEARWKRIT